MHNSIGIIICEKLFLNFHHGLIHFPYEKGYFLQLTAVTFQKIEQPHITHSPLPTIFGGFKMLNPSVGHFTVVCVVTCYL